MSLLRIQSRLKPLSNRIKESSIGPSANVRLMPVTDLGSVFEENLNLYDILEIPVRIDTILPDEVTIDDIKRQYKAMALKYHPDKTIRSDNLQKEQLEQKFQFARISYSILSNFQKRKQYDEWFKKRFQNPDTAQRNEFIEKLRSMESLASGKTDSMYANVDANSLRSMQEYGLALRKLKHFKKPYGNWKNLSKESNDSQGKPKMDRFEESSTLRIEMVNNRTYKLQEPIDLKNYLNKEIFRSNYVYDCYYSSRNDYIHDSKIVVYIICINPTASREIYDQFTTFNPWASVIIALEPRIPVHYYTDFQG